MFSESRVGLLFDVFKLLRWILRMDACVSFHHAVHLEMGVTVLGVKGLEVEFPICLSAGSFALE